MSQLFKRILLMLSVAGAVGSASAFSLLGPPDSWQIERIGYMLPGDIGAPMNLGEEYRWNTKIITYGVDESFLAYFGNKGRVALEQAIAILNNLPPVSQMSTNLSEFPLDSRGFNIQASALGLQDLKSETLGLLMEEMGLASPERYTWTLHDRVVRQATTNYVVVRRNFDPVTTQPSAYVNGTLYTYTIFDLAGSQPDFADAVEVPVDPLAYTYTAVASSAEGLWGGGLGYGGFFTGLTRDDVGGLRYLYRADNYNNETVLADATGTTGTNGTSGTTNNCPWCPPDEGGGSTSTNSTSTNASSFVDQALRPGVDKIAFQPGQYDSMVGAFIVTTNVWTDYYVSNNTLYPQTLQRIIDQPDILFGAEDMGRSISSRTTTAGWIDNDPINGFTTLAGPGVITPSIRILFNKIGPSLFNLNPGTLDEAGASFIFTWGSFDGSTNEPVAFPDGTSIQELEQQVLNGN